MIVVRRSGRRRKAGQRHPGGKLRQATQAERREDVTSVARKARRRVYGLRMADAGRAEAGDMLGRLFLTGEITEAQHSAGRAYAAVRTDYDKAMGARRLRSATDPGAAAAGTPREADDPDHVAWVARRRRAYDGVRAALQATGDPLAGAVLDAVVLEERQMWNHVGTLRIALNAVGRVLGQAASGGDGADKPSVSG